VKRKSRENEKQTSKSFQIEQRKKTVKNKLKSLPLTKKMSRNGLCKTLEKGSQIPTNSNLSQKTMQK
jgi:hypothetical protein